MGRVKFKNPKNFLLVRNTSLIRPFVDETAEKHFHSKLNKFVGLTFKYPGQVIFETLKDSDSMQ